MKSIFKPKKNCIWSMCGVIVLVAVFRVGGPAFFSFLDRAIINIVRKPSPSGFAFKTKEECEKNNGDWGRAGIFPTEFCRIPLADRGALCIAGFQCSAGICLSQYRLRDNPVIAGGICPKYETTFGCVQEVHFGFTTRGICRD